MKKYFKKIVAAVLTTAMAMSVGMPAFAAEEESISDVQKNVIIQEVNQEYGVQIKEPLVATKEQVEISEEEFTLRMELLAVLAKRLDNDSEILRNKCEQLLKELENKYPVEVRSNNGGAIHENQSPMYNFLAKTISKDSIFLTIKTRAKYMINSSGTKLFVGIDNVYNDITCSINKFAIDSYSAFVMTSGSTPKYTLQTAGMSMLVTVYGDLKDRKTGLLISCQPQSVNYNNDQL